MKSRRAKACDFTREAKAAIHERDHGLCILCGKPGQPNAHFIPRSQGGLGIEENGLTLCWPCHQKYDNSPARPVLKEVFRGYLMEFYPGWDEKKLYYDKYGGRK